MCPPRLFFVAELVYWTNYSFQYLDYDRRILEITAQVAAAVQFVQ
jgi:hypothetical protein